MLFDFPTSEYYMDVSDLKPINMIAAVLPARTGLMDKFIPGGAPRTHTTHTYATHVCMHRTACNTVWLITRVIFSFRFLSAIYKRETDVNMNDMWEPFANEADT